MKENKKSIRLDEKDIAILQNMHEIEAAGIFNGGVTSYMLAKKMYSCEEPEDPEKEKETINTIRDKCRFLDHRMKKLSRFNLILGAKKKGERRPGIYYTISNTFDPKIYPKIFFGKGAIQIKIGDKKISFPVPKSILIMENQNTMMITPLAE